MIPAVRCSCEDVLTYPQRPRRRQLERHVDLRAPPTRGLTQDAGVSAGGTEGQPDRRLSIIGFAAWSTAVTEAVLSAAAADGSDWLPSPWMVVFSDALAFSSAGSWAL